MPAHKEDLDLVWPAIIGAAGALGAAGITSAFSGSGKRISPHDDMNSRLRGLRKFGVETTQLEAANNAYMTKSQFKAQMDAAKQAGIHPLAALGISASGGGMMTPSGSTVSGSSMGDGIGYALGEGAKGIGDALGRRKADQMAAERHAAELSESAARTRNYDATTAATIAQTHAETSLIASQARRLMGESNYRQDLGGEVTFPSGRKFATGRSTRQQDMEDEYGGVVGEVYGASRFLRDFLDNYARKGRSGPAPRAVDRSVVPPGLYPELY